MRMLNYRGHRRLICKVLLACIFIAACGAVAAQPTSTLQVQWKAVQQQPGYATRQSTVDLLNSLSARLASETPDSALYYAGLALQMAKNQQYVIGEVRALNNMTKGYYVKGSYDSCLAFSDKALLLSKTVKDSLGMGVATSNIGLVYLGHEEFDRAIVQFKRALDILTVVNDSLQIAKNLFDLGICYDEIHDVKKAEQFLTKAIATDPSTEDHHITAMAFNRLGKTEYHAKNYGKAIDYYIKVLNYSEYQDKWETSFACQGLAEVFYAQGQFDKAVTYAKKAFDAAKEMNAKWDAEQALAVLAKSQAAFGDYKNAYTSQVLDQVYKDSLYGEAKQQVEAYFKLQANEAANVALEKENKLIHEKVRLTWMLIIAISAFALTLLVAIILLYRSYSAKLVLNAALLTKNEKISRLNQMKDQLFSVVSHDLRGPMTSLQQTLQLVNENALSAEEQNHLLQNLSHQVTVSNQMLNNLLTWATTQRKGMATNIATLTPDVILLEVLSVFELIADKKSITINYSSTGTAPLLADADQFRIIVQNILSNAIKFTPKKGSINIFFQSSERFVTINIQDTGIGMNKEKQEHLFKDFGSAISSYGTAKEKGTGIGLMIVKEFIEQNNGTLNLTSEEGKGTTFSVSFPAAPKS
jgi:signal transduction histidine kinase/Tfp pilus assembly protein PilF